MSAGTYLQAVQPFLSQQAGLRGTNVMDSLEIGFLFSFRRTNI